ncbi:MAG: NUDIX hydrolase [Thermoanaerobaculum sp.]|nr:NUDIX hydrolase [Thermoanaerobaculum sp.]MDW7966851.1 NUDIX hydrolase [Thermoanaerobaculum sp.]
MERSVECREVFSGKLLRLEVHRVQLEGCREAVREVVRHPGAVVVLPLLPDGRIVFVRQYRFAVGEQLLELPAGTRQEGEPPGECAARELREETGLTGELVPLGELYSAPGFCDEHLSCFAAHISAAEQPQPDTDEVVEVCPLTWREVQEALGQGVLRDAKTVACLFLAQQAGLLLEQVGGERC